MRLRRQLLKTIVLSTVFFIGIGLVTKHNSTPTEVKAAQYIGNYGSYTYSGDYYDSINFDATGGMNGTLRTSLTNLIIPKAFYTYGSQGETHLATQLQFADEDPTNSNNMVYLYTRDSVAKNPATTWNREHCWCQSLSNGNWGTGEGGTDILHLRPTYGSVNSARGNIPYGNSGKATVKKYNNMTYGYTGNGYFEPLDCVKGDVARIIMYVWTTYTGYKNYSPLNILSVFQSYNTLLSWHTMDKPDLLEGNRNDYSQTSRQQNRNPFVDHPELAWKIFGDQVSDSVKNACMEAYPANGGSGETVEPTGISLNKSTASVESGKTLQLRATITPENATGTVSWSSTNTSVATVNSSGLVTAKSVGQTTITATVNAFSASCTVTVTEATNNYGTLENPLSVADAIEVIDRANGEETSEPLYVKGIVSSNDAYSSEHSNYYHVWLSNNDNNVAQAFQLFKAKASSTITSAYSSENSLEGYEVVAYGYAKKYNGTTYELTTTSKTPANPEILQVRAPAATGIELDQDSVEIDINATVTLTATLTPSNTTSTVTWSSSDESVATVVNGVVTGVAAGTATITATVSGDIEAECEITVKAAAQATNATIDLSTDNTTDVSEQEISWVVSNVGSVVCEKASATTNANNYYGGDSNNRTSTRFYKNSVLTITPARSVEISSVVFEATTNDYASALTNSTWSNATAEVSNKTVTVTPTDGTSAFSATISGTCGFTSIVINYEQGEVIETPEDYYDKNTAFATIHGTTNVEENEEATDSIVFAQLGLDNAHQYTEPFEEGGFTVTFAGGSDDGKYYDTGSGIRTYGGGTITVSASGLISSITFTWSGSNKPNSADVANVGTYNVSTGVWTGSANSVVLTRPSGSGHWRLQSVTATYVGSTVTVSSAAMRFGATISKENWDSINDKWEIFDFGVLCMKKASLDSYASEGITTVEQAFRSGKKVTDLNNKSGEDHPYQIDDNYTFTVRIGVGNSSNYNMIVCAVPYILAGGHYYFFNEMRYCIQSLADYYLKHPTLDCDLSKDALKFLKGNYVE